MGSTIEVSAEALEWRPGVYGIVLHDAHVLLVKMKLNGQFVLPGGGIDLGERRVDALQRELLEETGISVSVGQLIDTTEDIFHYDPSGRSYHTLGFYYCCEPLSFDVVDNDQVIDDEIESPHWVAVNTLSAENFFYKPAFTLDLIHRVAKQAPS